MGERDTLSGITMWKIKNFMQKWTFQNFFEKDVGSKVGDPEHRGSIHLAQLAMVGGENHKLNKTQCFLDVPGARPREAPYGSMFLFTTAERQKTHQFKVLDRRFRWRQMFSIKFFLARETQGKGYGNCFSTIKARSKPLQCQFYVVLQHFFAWDLAKPDTEIYDYIYI